jgi:iron complex outermembrane receptor protein
MSGWAYLDAQYEDSPAYVNGSAPMNSPKHTAKMHG